MNASGTWPEGVGPLDHTADVGLVATAASLRSLLESVAIGMRMLIEGEEASGAAGAGTVGRTIEVEAGDTPALLVAWLRELLYLHQVEGLAFTRTDQATVSPTALQARVSLRPARGATREIKGVTYHGLQAEENVSGWHARVIFDV